MGVFRLKPFLLIQIFGTFFLFFTATRQSYSCSASVELQLYLVLSGLCYFESCYYLKHLYILAEVVIMLFLFFWFKQLNLITFIWVARNIIYIVSTSIPLSFIHCILCCIFCWRGCYSMLEPWKCGCPTCRYLINWKWTYGHYYLILFSFE